MQAGSLRSDAVLNGVDVLERDKFKQLAGLKIGLVTNHTGRNLAGKQTIDILKEAPNVQLVALFSPEHGIRGLLDVDKISDSKDEKTGLPIYSLYGETRRPKPEQLKDLDAIVYDIQDIGARFYTYTATLKNVMEEAAKLGKPIIVLDRPNPINGISVEGPLADEDKLSFIAAHTTPVRYGLTIGELGMMMNDERKIGADLRVIKMDGWSRVDVVRRDGPDVGEPKPEYAFANAGDSLSGHRPARNDQRLGRPRHGHTVRGRRCPVARRPKACCLSEPAKSQGRTVHSRQI